MQADKQDIYVVCLSLSTYNSLMARDKALQPQKIHHEFWPNIILKIPPPYHLRGDYSCGKNYIKQLLRSSSSFSSGCLKDEARYHCFCPRLSTNHPIPGRHSGYGVRYINRMFENQNPRCWIQQSWLPPIMSLKRNFRDETCYSEIRMLEFLLTLEYQNWVNNNSFHWRKRHCWRRPFLKQNALSWFYGKQIVLWIWRTTATDAGRVYVPTAQRIRVPWGGIPVCCHLPLWYTACGLESGEFRLAGCFSI